MEFEGLVWIHLAHDRIKCPAFMNTIMNHLIPLNTGKFFTG
jgi:hypothetical protein